MHVHDGLAGHLPHVDADVVTSGVKLAVESRAQFVQQAEQGLAFFRRGVEETGDVTKGDDKHVARVDGILVQAGIGQRIAAEHFLRCAEGAGGLG